MLDLTGERFGRLVVLDETARKNRRRSWRCQCDCGVETVVLQENLRCGYTHSCGCWHRERTSAVKTTHGHTQGGHKTTEYIIWRNMRGRCEKRNNQDYEQYGGRGIQVCERWREFANFFADMGRRPSIFHSLDRIENDLGYSPQNCRWATRAEQANNRQFNHVVLVEGQELTLKELADRLGMNYKTLHTRAETGWCLEMIITTPVGPLKLSHKGETLSIKAWAVRTGIGYNTLLWRFHRGWPPAKILTEPVRRRG